MDEWNGLPFCDDHSESVMSTVSVRVLLALRIFTAVGEILIVYFGLEDVCSVMVSL